MEQITSRKNPLIAHIRKLSSDRSYRRECGEFLGDGIKLLEEAVRWNAPLTCVVVTTGTNLPAMVPCFCAVCRQRLRQISCPVSAIWCWTDYRTRATWAPSGARRMPLERMACC